tara:strand:+ start:4226 stop:4903 length:678 start_codon:yes stop_codon:yes gene_type:complete
MAKENNIIGTIDDKAFDAMGNADSDINLLSWSENEKELSNLFTEVTISKLPKDATLMDLANIVGDEVIQRAESVGELVNSRQDLDVNYMMNLTIQKILGSQELVNKYTGITDEFRSFDYPDVNDAINRTLRVFNTNQYQEDRRWNRMENSEEGISKFRGSLTHDFALDADGDIAMRQREKGKRQTVYNHFTGEYYAPEILNRGHRQESEETKDLKFRGIPGVLKR